MNAFVRMRHFLKDNGQVFERLTSVEHKLLDHDKKFDFVFDKLQEKTDRIIYSLLDNTKKK